MLTPNENKVSSSGLMDRFLILRMKLVLSLTKNGVLPAVNLKNFSEEFGSFVSSCTAYRY